MNTTNSLARTAFGLAKGCHPGPVIAVSLASVGLSRAFGAGWRDARRIGGTVLMGQLAIGWHNDWVDAEVDALAMRTDKPIPTCLVARRTVGAAAVLAAGGCLIASAALGRRAGFAHLVAVSSAASYNAGLKHTPLSILPFGISFGLLPIVAHDTVNEDPTPVWATTAGALLGMAAHLVNVLPDRDADRDLGVLGLPQRLSPNASLALAAALLLGANGTIAVGTGGLSRRSLASFAASCVASGAALVTAQRVGGRTPFRLLLASALVQVGLVLWNRRADASAAFECQGPRGGPARNPARRTRPH